jgi:hypothetical protein
MAKAKGASGAERKVSFGKRKKGNSQKSFNKHSPKPKEYIPLGFGPFVLSGACIHHNMNQSFQSAAKYKSK